MYTAVVLVPYCNWTVLSHLILKFNSIITLTIATTVYEYTWYQARIGTISYFKSERVQFRKAFPYFHTFFIKTPKFSSIYIGIYYSVFFIGNSYSEYLNYSDYKYSIIKVS